MSIELLPEQQAKLEEMARLAGRNVNEMVVEAALWLAQFQLSANDRLTRSIGQADRGELLEEEQMDERVAKLLAGR